jgi:uncharacterized membrane protein YkvI
MDSHKVKVLYAVGLGLLLSDLIPTPADALYFYTQRVNKQKLERGQLSVKGYWTRDALAYYGYNAFWWGGVLLATHLIGKDYKQKRNLLIGLAGAGIVIGVIAKNIQKDEQFYTDIKNGK